MFIHLPPAVIDTLAKPWGAVKDVVWATKSSHLRQSHRNEKIWPLLVKIGEAIAMFLFFTMGLIMLAACTSIMVAIAIDIGRRVYNE